jgi:excisionase family DNA binding protein
MPINPKPAIDLLTIPEAAELLKISVSGMRRLQQRRRIPFTKIGSSIRFARTIQRHERTSTAGKISGHPSYRPEWLDVNFSPKTGVRPTKPKIRDKKGRKVTPLTVFPGDERHILFDTSWPWLLGGKITTSDNETGSGVLIGDRLVLTARHVLPWNSIGTGNWWMKFQIS